jgi:hypothetical protein
MKSFIKFHLYATIAACWASPVLAQAPKINSTSASTQSNSALTLKPFFAQVVGLQWLNPLQRRDYSTEWQLLWALGLAMPNKNDDKVRSNPERFTKIQSIGSIAVGNNGTETFEGYHEKYLDELFYKMHDIYFSSSTYFYNAHSLTDKKSWRELAGIHVEYSIPMGKLNSEIAQTYLRNAITNAFNIGNIYMPTTWSRSTPPEVRVTVGAANAGFTSLAAALDYLEAHPNETVWAMNWDAPSRPKDKQINENMVLLVLAGRDFKTERAPLAWIGHPASRKAEDFESKPGLPPKSIQAWQAIIHDAARNANIKPMDIGYVIHDAHNMHPDSSNRIGDLAQTLTMEVGEIDYARQFFNTSALLGDMGAGTALTNVALGIAYANHIGKNVLVAGTTDREQPIAVVVLPPEKVRPINHDEPWFRARSERDAHLMWWGIRHDAEGHMQGYSK